jgi:hypothetical protein
VSVVGSAFAFPCKAGVLLFVQSSRRSRAQGRTRSGLLMGASGRPGWRHNGPRIAWSSLATLERSRDDGVPVCPAVGVPSRSIQGWR